MDANQFPCITHYLWENHLITSQVRQTAIQRGVMVAAMALNSRGEVSRLCHLAWMVGELPPDIEDRLVEVGGPSDIARYARYVHKRFPEYEPAIARGIYASNYAVDVLGLAVKDIPAWITSMKEQAR